MRVKVLRAFLIKGEVQAVGTEIDLPDQLGREVVFVGKAERVADPPAAPKVEAKPEPKTMTTKSAAALVGKKGD